MQHLTFVFSSLFLSTFRHKSYIQKYPYQCRFPVTTEYFCLGNIDLTVFHGHLMFKTIHMLILHTSHKSAEMDLLSPCFSPIGLEALHYPLPVSDKHISRTFDSIKGTTATVQMSLSRLGRTEHRSRSPVCSTKSRVSPPSKQKSIAVCFTHCFQRQQRYSSWS